MGLWNVIFRSHEASRSPSTSEQTSSATVRPPGTGRELQPVYPRTSLAEIVHKALDRVLIRLSDAYQKVRVWIAGESPPITNIRNGLQPRAISTETGPDQPFNGDINHNEDDRFEELFMDERSNTSEEVKSINLGNGAPLHAATTPHDRMTLQDHEQFKSYCNKAENCDEGAWPSAPAEGISETVKDYATWVVNQVEEIGRLNFTKLPEAEKKILHGAQFALGQPRFPVVGVAERAFDRALDAAEDALDKCYDAVVNFVVPSHEEQVSAMSDWSSENTPAATLPFSDMKAFETFCQLAEQRDAAHWADPVQLKASTNLKTYAESLNAEYEQTNPAEFLRWPDDKKRNLQGARLILGKPAKADFLDNAGAFIFGVGQALLKKVNLSDPASEPASERAKDAQGARRSDTKVIEEADDPSAKSAPTAAADDLPVLDSELLAALARPLPEGPTKKSLPSCIGFNFGPDWESQLETFINKEFSPWILRMYTLEEVTDGEAEIARFKEFVPAFIAGKTWHGDPDIIRRVATRWLNMQDPGNQKQNRMEDVKVRRGYECMDALAKWVTNAR